MRCCSSSVFAERKNFMSNIDELLKQERNVVSNQKTIQFAVNNLEDRYKLATFLDTFPKGAKLMIVKKFIGTDKQEHINNNYLDSNKAGEQNVNALLSHPEYFGDNTYITISSRFPNGRPFERKITTVAHIDRIVTDIDPYYHNKPFTPEEIKAMVEALLEFPILPDFIVFSGSGLQVHFLLDPRKDVYHVQYAYQDLVKALNQQIDEHLKANGIRTGKIDNLLCNDICRLPYSRNNRSGNYAQIVYANPSIVRKPLSILLDLYGIEIAPYDKELSQEKRKNKKKNKNKRVNQNNKSSNLIGRMLSFYHANVSSFVEGYRNKTLYAFASSLMRLSCNDKFVSEETLKLNSEFPRPLPVKEVYTVLQSACKTTRRAYSLIHQIEWIGLDTSCMNKQELLCTSTPAQKQHARKQTVTKYERKQKKERASKKKKLIARICELFRKTGNQSYVARVLEISRNTVSKYLILAGLKVKNGKVITVIEEKCNNAMETLKQIKEKYTTLLKEWCSLTCSKSADIITGTVCLGQDTATGKGLLAVLQHYSLLCSNPDTFFLEGLDYLIMPVISSAGSTYAPVLPMRPSLEALSP